MITIEEIRTRKVLYERKYSSLRKEQKKDDDFYEMEFSTGIKKPYHPFRSFLPRRIIDTGAEHIASDNPIVTKKPLSHTQAAQYRADEVEKFSQALVMSALNASVQPVQEIVKNLGLRGEAFLCIKPNTAYPAYPERKKEETAEDFEVRMEAWRDEASMLMPVVWDVPDSMTVLASPYHRLNIPLEAFFTYKKTIEEIKEEYPEWPNKLGKKSGDLVDWLEYYSWTERYFEADEQAVTPSKGVELNILGVVPLIHIYSGLGKRSPDGKLETLARGLIYPARDTIIAYSRAMSQLDSIIAKYTHPLYMTTMSQEEVGEMDLSPGHGVTNIPAPMDQNFKFDSGMAPHPALFNYVQGLSNELEKYIPSPLSGGSLGAESGYQHAQQISQGTLKYLRLKEGAQHLLAAGIMLSLRIIKRVYTNEVVMRGLDINKKNKEAFKTFSLKLDTLEDFTQVQVRLEPADPETKDRRALLGARLRKDGSISQLRELEEYQGVPNATEELTQIWAERMMTLSPEIMQMISMKALEKLGMKEEAAALQQKFAQQEQAQASVSKTMGTPSRPANNGMEVADLMIRQMNRGAPQQVGPLGSRIEEPKEM